MLTSSLTRRPPVQVCLELWQPQLQAAELGLGQSQHVPHHLLPCYRPRSHVQQVSSLHQQAESLSASWQFVLPAEIKGRIFSHSFGLQIGIIWEKLSSLIIYAQILLKFQQLGFLGFHNTACMHACKHTYIQRTHFTRGTDSSHYPRVFTAKIFQRPAYVICRVGWWLLNCCSSVLNILLLLGFLSCPFRNRSWLCFSFRTTFSLLLWTSHLSKTRLPERDPQLLQ